MELYLEFYQRFMSFFSKITDFVGEFYIKTFEIIKDSFLEVYLFFFGLSFNIDFFQSTFFAVLFVLIWSAFFIFYNGYKTIKYKYLVYSIFIGTLVAFVSFFLEKLVLHESFVFLKDKGGYFIKSYFSGSEIFNIFELLLFSLLIVALIEEGTKYLFLKRYMKTKGVDQVVDGMKIGIWLGLGFAFLENFIYFINFSASGDFTFMNIIGRGFLSTLAHGLFGALMGYYLVMKKLENPREIIFELVQEKGRQVGVPVENKKYIKGSALILPVLAHGLFNFFLFLDAGVYSLILLLIILAISLYWYGKKKNVQLYFEQNGTEILFSPEVASSAESKILENKKLTRDQKREDLLWLNRENKS